MNIFERRRILIKTMEEGEVEDYYQQVQLPTKERKMKIKETRKFVSKYKDSNPNDILIFIVKEIGTNKVIGTILTKCIGKGIISLQLSIPNEIKELSYGVETIDQFKKICEEEEFFEGIKFIQLDVNSKVAQKYIECNKKDMMSSYICIA